MKKLLIAGATSIAMAALPVVGVFATDPAPVEDTLTVTVNESCTFTRNGGAGSFTKAMEAAGVENNFGESTFTSACNNGTGYKITASFTDLAQANGDGDEIQYSTTTPSSEHLGYWTATKTGSASGNLENDKVAFSRDLMDPAGGSTYSVKYQVSLHDNQAQGTYTGTATYTLAQNPAS